MARSISTIPKTSTKPATAPAATAVATAAPEVKSKAKKEKAPKVAKEAVANITEAVPATTVAAAPVADVPAVTADGAAVKEKKPKAAKEKKPKAAAASAPVGDDAAASTEPAATEVTEASSLAASIAEVVQIIRDVEAEAKQLRAQCKSLIFASKKECNSSRKFIKAKKEAARLAGEEPYLTGFQTIDASVRARSKNMVNEMVAVKNKIAKFTSVHNELVKAARKTKKENRKRTPPIASTKPIRVHAKIAEFMGVAADARLSRHEVFTAIREHIKTNGCYFEGKGKKFVNPDAKLAPLFTEVPAEKRESIDYFNMQKYLKDYFYKDEVAPTPAATTA